MRCRIAAGQQFGLRFFNANPGRVAGQDDADVFAVIYIPPTNGQRLPRHRQGTPRPDLHRHGHRHGAVSSPSSLWKAAAGPWSTAWRAAAFRPRRRPGAAAAAGQTPESASPDGIRTRPRQHSGSPNRPPPGPILHHGGDCSHPRRSRHDAIGGAEIPRRRCRRCGRSVSGSMMMPAKSSVKDGVVERRTEGMAGRIRKSKG